MDQAFDLAGAVGAHPNAVARLGAIGLDRKPLVAGCDQLDRPPTLVWLPHDKKTQAILLGAGVIVLVGAIDDLLELSADFKLVGQLLAAAIPVIGGVRVESFTLPYVHHALSLGMHNALLYFHAGMIEKAIGDTSAARRDLRTALAINPHFSILYATTAARVLRALGGGA